jgi:hypothetical protein
MYIDNMTITAFVVFAVAMVLFVKQCFIDSCINKEDRQAGVEHDVEPGNRS